VRRFWPLLILILLVPALLVAAQEQLQDRLFLGLAYYFQGIERDNLGMRNLGIAELKKLTESNPQATEPRLTLAVALHSLGYYEEAGDHYRRLTEQTDWPEIRVLWGDALRAQGKFMEAYSQYTQALDGDPDLVTAHYGLGVVLEGWGRLDRAEEHYQRVYEQAPHLHKNSLRLASLFQEDGRLEEAIEVLLTARSYGEKAEIAYQLGRAYYQLGDYQQAKDHLQRALQLDPEHGAARSLLSTIP
jgi:tetratricopeptide (TPR) repeat protein